MVAIKPLEGLFSRELLLLLIYSKNNLFSFTSLVRTLVENILSPSPKRREGWLWVNMEYSFFFLSLKIQWNIVLHPAYKCTTYWPSPCPRLTSQPGEWYCSKSICAKWMERDFSPMQCLHHDVVNLFKCKPVQFTTVHNKICLYNPVLTTAGPYRLMAQRSEITDKIYLNKKQTLALGIWNEIRFQQLWWELSL